MIKEGDFCFCSKYREKDVERLKRVGWKLMDVDNRIIIKLYMNWSIANFQTSWANVSDITAKAFHDWATTEPVIAEQRALLNATSSTDLANGIYIVEDGLIRRMPKSIKLKELFRLSKDVK